MKPLFLQRLAMASLLTVLGAAASAQTFKIATLSPDGSQWTTLMRAGADQIKTRTEGRVEFKFYTGGAMGNDHAVLSKIRLGQLQGGAVTVGSLSEYAKDVQVYSMPLKFKNFDEVDYVRSHMDAQLSKELDDGGMVNFGFAEGGFAYAMSKNVPVPSVDVLRGEKVWIPEGDKQSETTLLAFGVTPVPLSLGDVLTSLHTGIINTVASSPIATLALQWHTEVKYITDLPLDYFMATLAISKKDFAKISPADQAVVREVMTGVFHQIDQQNRKDNVSAYNALLKQGIKVVKPTVQDVAGWEHNSELAWAQILKAGIVSPQAEQELDGYLKTYRAGKK